jgi:hypothetical protein
MTDKQILEERKELQRPWLNPVPAPIYTMPYSAYNGSKPNNNSTKLKVHNV